MAKSDDDLPESGDLKRTGRKGELVTDKYRKAKIADEKNNIKKNAKSGMIKKLANRDTLLNAPSQIKDFAKDESDKKKRRNDSRQRIKELKSRGDLQG